MIEIRGKTLQPDQIVGSDTSEEQVYLINPTEIDHYEYIAATFSSNSIGKLHMRVGRTIILYGDNARNFYLTLSLLE